MARIKTYLEQNYEISTFIIAYLTQSYGDRFVAYLDQWYGDSPVIKAYLDQYYGDTPYLKQFLNQDYGDALVLISSLVQEYGISTDHHSFLEQIYHILETKNVSYLEQLYDIKNTTLIKNYLESIYTIEADGTLSKYVNTLSINGVVLDPISIDVEFSQNSYVGNIEISLPEIGNWLPIDFLQEILLNANGEEYKFLVSDKNKKETYQRTDLRVSGKSSGMILDFPYATPVDEDFPLGMASDIAIRLAALKGITLDWQIPVDWFLTSEDIQVAGEAPLSGIRKIKQAIGGILQSDPDGSLYLAPRFIVDSDKFDKASPDYYLTTGEDFLSTETSPGKRDGFNRYSISNIPSTEIPYDLIPIKISESEYIIRVYQVPWTTKELQLVTSALEDVSILRLADVFDEEICDLVEIVNGAGNTSKPVHEIRSFSYEGREDLGNIESTESGDLTTFTVGESMVEFNYYSKYRQWRVTDMDTESVQVILKGLQVI